MLKYLFATLTLTLLISPLSLLCAPQKKSPASQSSIALRSASFLAGLVNGSIGTGLAVLSLKLLETTTELLAKNYTKLRADGIAHAKHLHYIDPHISSFEANFWAGAHTASRAPLILLPTCLALACTIGLGYLAVRFLKSGYRFLKFSFDD